jgi:predicted N-formylglutamate amidohydrolase
VARPSPRAPTLLLTCEHGGNRIPPEYRTLFKGARETLDSHRGWDPGALDTARKMAKRLRLPLLFVTWSRLLVESNRTDTRPGVWSKYTEALPDEAKERILARYWRPHRERVLAEMQKLTARAGRVVHVAVHSFTPVMNGEVRNADVGILYDPRRKAEAAFCARWKQTLAEAAPDLRVRMNYPYRGTADGLSTWLRKRYPDPTYAGVEVELNQALFASPRAPRIGPLMSESVAAALDR